MSEFIPTVTLLDSGKLWVKMRPGDTQGNFVLFSWDAVIVDNDVLIVGDSYKPYEMEFVLPVTTRLYVSGRAECETELGQLPSLRKEHTCTE